jgi:hypothetical protein
MLGRRGFCPVLCEVLPFRLFYYMHSCLCCLQDWIIQYDPPDDPRVKSQASTLFVLCYLVLVLFMGVSSSLSSC